MHIFSKPDGKYHFGICYFMLKTLDVLSKCLLPTYVYVPVPWSKFASFLGVLQFYFPSMCMIYIYISEKLILFCNLITWPNLVQMIQMISNFNMCRNISKFYVVFFCFVFCFFSIKCIWTLNIEFWGISTHAVKIWDHLKRILGCAVKIWDHLERIWREFWGVLLKFEIIWRELVKLWDYRILFFLKHSIHLKWHQIFLNNLCVPPHTHTHATTTCCLPLPFIYILD